MKLRPPAAVTRALRAARRWLRPSWLARLPLTERHRAWAKVHRRRVPLRRRPVTLVGPESLEKSIACGWGLEGLDSAL
jgi:hypothetical protein